ncbi:hypothetical protein BC361_30300 [Ensifer sp. LC54]|nr:hypothetical protein BC361_30300 [Ensifer sp. LC54]OCP19724.1 hypothetical protein BC363_30605 [Ensifer sp. LC384]
MNENGWRVLFTRTADLIQKLQVARRKLQPEAAIVKLAKFDVLILDDRAYATKDQAETSVLFELTSARYERRSILVVALYACSSCHLTDLTTTEQGSLV